jgi:coenzyme F420-0:L-glutamate ligase/coenzyme F420-1:gamma-L-glutamate ligase
MFMDVVMDLIKKRRSVRKFYPRKVEGNVLREVLEAGPWAPSAHNAQPWRFVVLIDKAVKQNLAETMANAWIADMSKDGVSAELCYTKAKASVERFTQAPVLTVACLTMKDMIQYADEERQKCERDLALQSLSAAIQNMLLAAHAKGLGACWFSAPVFCKYAVRKVLQIPQDVEPQALITLGYAAEKPTASPRKRLQSYSYLNCWGKRL